ncbi:Bro-N domain-containing protein [archaeon]|jgi:DNA-damage-inducible protein D|nr:Bro-N domain-containing protein [archaeon]MBT4648675.1 Bro-N domain-containing protein [archaeon]MBT6821799.1 Bro-N domain-containing protein [archaeon]MBT7391194.1 Bro-N domain-containing protein [archaeon]
MKKSNKLVVFQDKKIRRIWHNDEWYFSIIDVVLVLTDSNNPRNYWSMLKKREKELGIELSTYCVQLKLKASDGKLRFTDCANTKLLFRIIQSIPSKKAEPFKLWLAQVGHERVEEIENPELGQDRIKDYYELKGYPKDWIDKRLRGIATRQELTDEWKDRKIKTEKEFAILTNEISKATFGKTIGEYKEFKQLKKKNQNLRDHMTDLELIFTMLGEKTTTEITKERNSQGFDECKDSAKEGGEAANDARKSVEKRLGRSTISKKNIFLTKTKREEKA